MWHLASSSYERKEFDKENWAENRYSRYVYVEDLIDGENHIRLTESKFRIILGDAEYEDDSTMIFYIGYST